MNDLPFYSLPIQSDSKLNNNNLGTDFKSKNK